MYVCSYIKKNHLDSEKQFAFTSFSNIFVLTLLYDTGFMDWSDLWNALSVCDSLHFHKACKWSKLDLSHEDREKDHPLLI